MADNAPRSRASTASEADSTACRFRCPPIPCRGDSRCAWADTQVDSTVNPNILSILALQLDGLQQAVEHNKLITKELKNHCQLHKDSSRGVTPAIPQTALPEVTQPAVVRLISNPRIDLTKPLLDNASRQVLKAASVGDDKEPASRGNIQHRESARVFTGASDVQKQVAKALSDSKKPAVQDLYKEDGSWPRLVQHTYFQGATTIVIVMNTLWIGVDTDFNKADVLCDAPVISQVAGNFFCACFAFELLARALAFKKPCSAIFNMSFLFDLVLVLLMIWETWVEVLLYLIVSNHDQQGTGGKIRSASVLRVFRTFRLLRVARVTRVFQALPELQILAKGMGAAVRGTSVVLAMLLLVIYIFSVTFTQLLAGTAISKDHFENVPQAMNYMLIQVLCGFDGDFVNSLAQEGWIYYLLWLIYILVGSFVLMNMLIGILCDVVSGTAESEKEVAALQDLEIEVEHLDTDGNMTVSREESSQIILDPAVMKKLQALGVDVSAFLEFAYFVFDDCPEMAVTDFVQMVVQFRGTRYTTVKDIVDLRKFVTTEVNHLETLIHEKLASS